jgi:hypothetical protein
MVLMKGAAVAELNQKTRATMVKAADETRRGSQAVGTKCIVEPSFSWA